MFAARSISRPIRARRVPSIAVAEAARPTITRTMRNSISTSTDRIPVSGCIYTSRRRSPRALARWSGPRPGRSSWLRGELDELRWRQQCGSIRFEDESTLDGHVQAGFVGGAVAPRVVVEAGQGALTERRRLPAPRAEATP